MTTETPKKSKFLTKKYLVPFGVIAALLVIALTVVSAMLTPSTAELMEINKSMREIAENPDSKLPVTPTDDVSPTSVPTTDTSGEAPPSPREFGEVVASFNQDDYEYSYTYKDILALFGDGSFATLEVTDDEEHVAIFRDQRGNELKRVDLIQMAKKYTTTVKHGDQYLMAYLEVVENEAVGIEDPTRDLLVHFYDKMGELQRVETVLDDYVGELKGVVFKEAPELDWFVVRITDTDNGRYIAINSEGKAIDPNTGQSTDKLLLYSAIPESRDDIVKDSKGNSLKLSRSGMTTTLTGLSPSGSKLWSVDKPEDDLEVCRRVNDDQALVLITGTNDQYALIDIASGKTLEVADAPEVEYPIEPTCGFAMPGSSTLVAYGDVVYVGQSEN